MRMQETYGIVYLLAYLAALALMLWLHWGALLHKDGAIYLLAAIFGVAAGAALTLAILTEVGGRTVLLIPKAANKLIDKGHAAGRAAERKRNEEARKRFGVEEDGVVVLRYTPEVLEFLENGPEDSEDSGE